MKPVLVLYATREGQTGRIAERFAEVLAMRGLGVELVNAVDRHDLDISGYAAAVMAGSIHFGKHEKELVHLVKQKAQELARIPTLLLSVSLSAATVVRPGSTEKQRQAARREVRKSIEGFAVETSLSCGRAEAVAGALLYRQYGFGTRLVMRLIAVMSGAHTDTSRNWVYTDWAALEQLAVEWSRSLEPATQPEQAPEPVMRPATHSLQVR